MELVVDCYHLTRGFPKNELYGLGSQIQRSAVSVPANIAEGNERQHTREYLRHLSIAYSSLAELETHLEIAKRLGYMTEDNLRDLLASTNEIGRMINGLRNSLLKLTSGL